MSDMQLTKEQIQDKIFELEMELKELTMRLDALEMENNFIWTQTVSVSVS